MQIWERFVLGRVGIGFALVATLAIPVVGIVILRFLLSGPPVELTLASEVSVVLTERPVGQLRPAPGISQLPTVLPVATAAPIVSVTPRPRPSPTARPTGVVNATDGLNVRAEPTTRARVLRILPFEIEVKLSGRERLAEGLRWVELDQGGWVQDRYLNR